MDGWIGVGQANLWLCKVSGNNPPHMIGKCRWGKFVINSFPSFSNSCWGALEQGTVQLAAAVELLNSVCGMRECIIVNYCELRAWNSINWRLKMSFLTKPNDEHQINFFLEDVDLCVAGIPAYSLFHYESLTWSALQGTAGLYWSQWGRQWGGRGMI